MAGASFGGSGVRERLEIRADELLRQASALFSAGYRLASVAAHDDGSTIRIVYLFLSGPPDRRVELHVVLDAKAPAVPSLGRLSFPASRFEREIHDLFGVVPVGHPLLRPLVLHQHWPREWHPMLHSAGESPPMRSDAEPFLFVEVEGAGVYEIPVGPVHAGLTEPGHFRFSVVGETILEMKARLWYTHRGVERLFEGQEPDAAVALAERVSGDSAIGHNLAFCLAVEEASGVVVDAQAQRLRALLLELERLYNHIADIGALCNDVGFGLANARALALRERLLRLNAEVTGHRLLRGAIQPGRVALLRLPSDAELSEIGARFEELIDLAESNTVVMDRFRGTAVLSSEDAIGTGTLGVVARASGLTLDARLAHPFVDQAEPFEVVCERDGDVHARYRVRVGEVRAGIARIAAIGAGAGSLRLGATELVPRAASGVGIVEGWRGSIVHRIEIDERGRLSRVKIVDPSFLNWPALSVALADTIVPDFPLANKSFNLSYAGNDL